MEVEYKDLFIYKDQLENAMHDILSLVKHNDILGPIIQDICVVAFKQSPYYIKPCDEDN